MGDSFYSRPYIVRDANEFTFTLFNLGCPARHHTRRCRDCRTY